MSHRKWIALVAIAGAALAVLGLAGCDSKVGTAAIVGGHRISDSDVGHYLTADAKPFSVQSQTGSEQTIVPRSYILTVLIQNRLFTDALARTSGGVPSDGDVTTAEGQLTQGASEQQQQQQYTKYGFTASFAAVDLRNSALEQILAQRLKLTTSIQPLVDAVHKLHPNVTVSARYGSWNDDELSIDFGPTDGVPSFVRLHPSSGPDQIPAG